MGSYSAVLRVIDFRFGKKMLPGPGIQGISNYFWTQYLPAYVPKFSLNQQL